MNHSSGMMALLR